MEDVAAEVARLQARAGQVRDARVRAEHDKEQAATQVTQAMGALRAEFGVETPEAARALREDLDRQIAAEVQRIEEALR